MHEKTFREAVCDRFGVAPAGYEQEVLWRCFFPSTLGIGKLLWLVKPDYFRDDLELIRDVADCVSVNEVRTELNDHRYHRPIKSFLRRILRVRVSGQRLVDMASLVFR